MKKFTILVCLVVILTSIQVVGANYSNPSRDDIAIEVVEKPLRQLEFKINVNEEAGADNVDANVTITRQIFRTSRFVEIDVLEFPQHTVRFLFIFGLAEITVNGKVYSTSVSERSNGFVTLCTVRVIPECGSCG